MPALTVDVACHGTVERSTTVLEFDDGRGAQPQCRVEAHVHGQAAIVVADVEGGPPDARRAGGSGDHEVGGGLDNGRAPLPW